MIPEHKLILSLKLRREFLKQVPPVCDFCSLVMNMPTQVRLMNYYFYPSKWKCCGCMGKISWEPGPNQNTEDGRIPIFYERRP